MYEINRPEWDEIWMSMAETISKRSHHPQWKVGAIIVNNDTDQIFSFGFNGLKNGNSCFNQNCIKCNKNLTCNNTLSSFSNNLSQITFKIYYNLI